LTGSIDLMMSTAYLSIPPILVYLFLWIVLGLFFLLKEIPVVGFFFSIVFAFGPFLLIFSSLLLCLFNLGLLFFAAPAAALQPHKRMHLVQRILALFQAKLFSSLLLFFIALVPIGLVVGLLCLAAMLTNVSYLMAEKSLSVALEWFFIMLPFAALLTPAVSFFFHFAAESYHLLEEKAKCTSPS
jgi:hypothetical protein